MASSRNLVSTIGALASPKTKTKNPQKFGSFFCFHFAFFEFSVGMVALVKGLSKISSFVSLAFY